MPLSLIISLIEAKKEAPPLLEISSSPLSTSGFRINAPFLRSSSSSSNEIPSPPCESPTIVKSCKHCSFSFRSDERQQEGLEYCSKDCRVCHTWFKSSAQPTPIKTSLTSSPKTMHEKAMDLKQNHTNEKLRQHYTEIKRHSDTSDCYKETWRVSNPKGEKIVLNPNCSPRSSSKGKKIEKTRSADSSSPNSTTAASGEFLGVTRPLAQRPYLFY